MGAQVLGQEEPGLGRWTEEEIRQLYKPERVPLPLQAIAWTKCNETAVLQCIVLAGSPGILLDEAALVDKPNMHRARGIDAE